MITCKECIESLRPDDPRIGSGRYRMCGCDYCSKPSYYRELEEVKEPSDKEDAWTKMELTAKQWDMINQLRAGQNHILNKINSHIGASKKWVDKENYEPF